MSAARPAASAPRCSRSFEQGQFGSHSDNVIGHIPSSFSGQSPRDATTELALWCLFNGLRHLLGTLPHPLAQSSGFIGDSLRNFDQATKIIVY